MTTPTARERLLELVEFWIEGGYARDAVLLGWCPAPRGTSSGEYGSASTAEAAGLKRPGRGSGADRLASWRLPPKPIVSAKASSGAHGAKPGTCEITRSRLS